MFRKLSLQSRLPVQRVKLDNPAIPASAGDDGTILEDADGEDGAVMDLPDDLGDSVVPPAPDEDIAVAVAGDDVSITGIGQTCHVLGFISLIKDSCFSTQAQTCRIKLKKIDILDSIFLIKISFDLSIYLPKIYKTLSNRNNGVSL